MGSLSSVMVVEDDGLIAMHLAEMLDHAGYAVLSTEYSGENALARLKEPPLPDVILMDIGLGGRIDGIETARRLRKRYGIPVIFLSAYSNEARIAEIKEIPSCQYILKPCLEQDIVAAINIATKT